MMPELRRALPSSEIAEGMNRRRTRGPWRERDVVVDFEASYGTDGWGITALLPDFDDDGSVALTRDEFYAR